MCDEIVGSLGDRYRCIVPELPFGAHTTPMLDDAYLTLPALATMIAEFLLRTEAPTALHEASLAGGSCAPVGWSGVAGAQ